MSASILFISDLHLEPARPDITRTLLQFLRQHSGQCSALYILGDLFEVWIGDDEDSPLADTVATALHQFSDAGAAVYIMHGNRDFLLGKDYARRCAASVITEPYTVSTAHGEILLLHGDSLCTDDADYQAFRELVRQPDWQQEFLAKPLQERRDFAQQARQQSRTATASKSMEIMDVNAAAVLQLIRSSGKNTLLHGHTHRPAVHTISIEPATANGTEATRIVLGSWEEKAWYAESDADGIELRSFPLLSA